MQVAARKSVEVQRVGSVWVVQLRLEGLSPMLFHCTSEPQARRLAKYLEKNAEQLLQPAK